MLATPKKIVSWNVNGIRAVHRKGLMTWFESVAPDILCVQETKAHPDQVPEELLSPLGYRADWASAKKKGYSGVATFSRIEPNDIRLLGDEEFDDEGRVLVSEFNRFTLINAYFPNSQEAGARLDYKLRFCDRIFSLCQDLQTGGKHLILCGDYNIAHKPIDLENPARNTKNPGFLPEERAWMDKFTDAGFKDTFRMFESGGKHYSWWSYRFRAREKNIGWRIDYHSVNPEFSDQVQKAEIWSDVMGSDHCPVYLELK